MALTWRNVDTPDFRSSLDGIRTFGNLFGDAVGGIERGLSQFDASIDKRANSAFAMDLLKYQDPAAYKAALASGALFNRPDAQRLNGASIQAAGSRSGELLNQAVAEGALDDSIYNRGKNRGFDAAKAAAAPLVSQYLQAATDPATLAEFNAKNPTFGAGLSFADRAGLTKDAQAFEGGALANVGARLGNVGTGIRNDVAKFDFGNAKEDRALADAAEVAYADIAKNTFDGEGALTMLNGMNLPPKVYNALLGRLGGGAVGGGSDASAAISGAVGGGSGGDPTRVITSGGAGNLGIGSLPDSVKTLGQAVDFGKSLNRRGQESSAMGVYQIVQSTMESVAPTVLGANWRDKPMDFASQDAVAKKIFENNRGSAGALKKQWVSLSIKDAERVRNMPWEEARQFIAAGESRSDPAALALGAVAVDQGLRTNNMERNAGSIASTYAKSAGDNRPASVIAAELGSDPAFKAFGTPALLENIQLIQAKARDQSKTINAAVAADMLKQTATSSKWGRFAPSWLGGGSDQGGFTINTKQVDDLIANYSNGGVDDAVAANAMQAQAEQVKATAQSKYDAAMARYTQAEAAQRRGVRVDLAPIAAQVNRAGALLSATLARTGSDRSLTTFNEPPPRVPLITRTAGAGPLRTAPAITSPQRGRSRREQWMNALAPLGSD